MYSITQSVGKNAKNAPEDTNKVWELLKARKTQAALKKAMADIEVPEKNAPDFMQKLIKAIEGFQKNVQRINNPDGVISPLGSTILFLGGIQLSGKQIIVDLDDQNLYAYEGNRLVHSFFCASGDKVHPTATWPSAHKIFRKHKVYRSKKYNAQMDFAMFLTADGKAIHQSNAVSMTSILKDFGINQLGSHGCVRLSKENASVLFDWAPLQTTVFIDLESVA